MNVVNNEVSGREQLAGLSLDISLALIKQLPLKEMLQACAEAFVNHLQVAFARIWTVNEEENMLELQASAGIYTHLDGAHARVPIGKFKIGLIAEERKPHLTNSVIGDPRVGNQEWAQNEGMVAFAGYPLLVEERLVGVVAMFSRFTLSDFVLKAIEAVANGIALGIERKQALSAKEAALKEKEETLLREQQAKKETEAAQQQISNILESISDGFAAYDKDWNYIYVNKEGARLLHRDQEDLIGNNVWKKFPDMVGTKFHETLTKTVKEQVSIEFEDYYAPLDTWLEIRTYPTEYGTSIYYKDVTERKLQQSRVTLQYEVTTLLSKANSLQEIVPQVFESICTHLDWDRGLLWNVNSENTGLEYTAGYQRSVNIGDEFEEYNKNKIFVLKEGIPGKVWHTKQMVWISDITIEKNLPRASLANKLELHTCVAIPILVGDSVIGVMEFFSHKIKPVDEGMKIVISNIGNQLGQFIERRKAENELRLINAELEKRVEDRTAKLIEANKELESFSYSVSHDLRAPIRHINGFIKLLLKNNPGKLDESSLRHLNVISESATRAGQLVDDLLAFSRMGRMEMRLLKVDLNQLVMEVKNDLMQHLTNRDISWKIDPLPIVQADPSMLRIVISNLLSNAIKYTGQNNAAQIEMGVTDKDNEHIIYVKDNGVGFDMRYVDKLFGVFQRLHKIEEFEGTGIGLANVRRIISKHGGRTWAEGELNKGATFYFSLPKLKEE